MSQQLTVLVAARDEAERIAAELAAAAPGLRVLLRHRLGRLAVGEASIAIVAASPGTTRDRVSEVLEIGGVRVTLSDTAGLRATGDEVEADAYRLTGREMRGRRIMWVLVESVPDAAHPPTPTDPAIPDDHSAGTDDGDRSDERNDEHG